MRHDDELLDAIAVLALGALPRAEAETLAAHVATCDSCTREYRALREAADLVAYGAESMPESLDEVTTRRMKSRVMIAVRADAARTTAAPAPAASVPAPASPVSAASPASAAASPASVAASPASAAESPASAAASPASAAASPASTALRATSSVSEASPAGAGRAKAAWLPYALAAAAVLVAAVTSFDAASLKSQTETDAARIATLQADAEAGRVAAGAASARARVLDERLALIVAPGSRHFAVPRGEVVATRGRILIALRDLPALPKGKTYQAWTLATGAKTVAPSVTFAPDARGVAIVELPERADRLAAVAVSVEPDGGSKTPTSKPTFVRALT